MTQRVILLRDDAPGQARQPVEVVTRHVELRGRRLEKLQLGKLLLDHLGRLGWQLALRDPLAELSHECLLVILLGTARD